MLEYGPLRIKRIPQEHQVIWLQKSCVSSLTVSLLTILLWESLVMNACLEEDPIQAEIEEKLESIFLQSRFKSRELIFQKDGLLKLLISLIDLFKENHSID